MRSFRSLLTSSLLALSVLGGSAVAVSAAAPEKDTFDIDEVWCFDDVVLVYCTEMTGTFKVSISDSGDEQAATKLRERVVISDPSGAQVGTYTTVVNDRSLYDADGGMSIHSVTHTRSTGGDLTCTSTVILKMRDFAVQVDHQTLRCR